MVRQAHHERRQAHHERRQAHHERRQAHHERAAHPELVEGRPQAEDFVGFLAAGFLATGFLAAVALLAAVVRLAVLALAFAAGFLSAFGAGSGFSVNDNDCSRDISRDFRRAAALRWMMPFCAALSSERTASRTTSATSSLVVATATVAFLTNVRTADRAA